MKWLHYRLIVLLVFLVGCAATPPVPSLDGFPLEKISAMDASHLYAADPAGKRVAFHYQGLSLQQLGSDEKQVISQKNPVALAWSGDGGRFSAAFSLPEDQTLLAVYSASGSIMYETVLPMTVSKMAWGVNGELLAAGYSLKVYSFGANLSQSLAVVKDEKVDLIPLTDVTLKPGTTKALKPVLQKALPVLFSPLGDELVYVRLHDPPEFSPYLNVLYKNWQSDGARKLLALPLQVVELNWVGSDVAEVNTSGGKHRIELWSSSVTLGDESLQYRFNNGRLFKRGTLIADWGRDAQFQQVNGGRFLLATNKGLYLGAGLDHEFPGDDRQNEWQLRRWRYQGLISPEEFLRLLKKDKK